MSERDPSEFRVEEVEVDHVRPLRHAHLRPGRPEHEVEYDTDAEKSARHFRVRSPEGETIGVGSLHDENRVAGQPPYRAPGVRIRGLAVESTWSGQGVGRALVERMVEVARAHGAHEVWANARKATVRLLEREGFEQLSAAFEIPRIGTHWVMAKPLKHPRRPRS